MSHNVYDPPSISGYNADPPPDDGTKTSDNKLEWDKHKTKLGDPVKTLAEAINAETHDAFDKLVITDDPAVEKLILALSEYIKPEAPAIVQRARRATSANEARTLSQFTDNVVVSIQEFG